MIIKSDDKQLKLTPEYIEAIKQLMIQCILMMRILDKENSECWYYGVCSITDFMDANGHRLTYGAKEDIPATFDSKTQIWVAVPF